MLASLTLPLYSRSDYVRNPRESFVAQDDELIFSDDILAAATSKNAKKSAASEQVNVKMEFPGNEYKRPKRSKLAKGEFEAFFIKYFSI